MNYLIVFSVFGFFVTAMAGLIASWFDRKVTARIQYRVGPPLLQPLIDLVKLSGKELLIPQTASRTTFLMAPVMGLSSVILVSTLLWMNDLHFGQTFHISLLFFNPNSSTIPASSSILGLSNGLFGLEYVLCFLFILVC